MAKSKVPKVMLRLVILGEQKVGKSTLFCTFSNREYSDTEAWCRFKALRVRMEKFDVIMNIYDITGGEDNPVIGREKWICCCLHDEGFLLVYDVSDASTFHNLMEWLNKIRRRNGTRNTVVILVGNKKDEHRDAELDKSTVIQFCLEYGVQFTEVDAKNFEDVKKIFKYLVYEILITKGLLPPVEIDPALLELNIQNHQELSAETVRISEDFSLASFRAASFESIASSTAEQEILILNEASGRESERQQKRADKRAATEEKCSCEHCR